LPSAWDAIYAMYYRQIKRWVTARSRIASSIVQPLIWLVFLGIGFGNIFSGGGFIQPQVVSSIFTKVFGGVDYITFLTSGLVIMTAFIGSFISGLSVIWDKQFGFLKESLVAPAPRSASIVGRTLGDATVNTVQALLIILVAMPFVHGIILTGIPIALFYVFIMSIGFTGLGIAIALKFSSIEGFQFLINLITMPMLFMSGVFYPISSLPKWLQIIDLANPLVYAVDGSRYWLVGVRQGIYFMNPTIDFLLVIGISIALIGVAVRMFSKTTVED
jgi:ABC-2 type transport system permease protein